MTMNPDDQKAGETPQSPIGPKPDDGGTSDRKAWLDGRLFNLYDHMLGNVDIPTVLRDVADVLCRDLSAERASVYLVDKATHELESVAIVGNVAQTIRVPIRESSLAGYCAISERSFLVPDAYGDLSQIDPKLEFDRSWDEINAFRTRDVMCAPAMFKDQLMGVAQVINSTDGAFDQDDLQQLAAVARLIGYALYHARLYNDLATLKQLEKEKAQFMQVMVHELRSPVSASTAMIGLLRDQTFGDDYLDSLPGRIARRLSQMGELISDILVLAKVKSGDPLGEIGVVDLRDLGRQVAEDYRGQAEAKGLVMTVDLPSASVPVRVDSQGCKLALSNLVSNAVKYTEAGSVRVSLASAEGWAALSIADSGIGIPEQDVPKLFAEFFRAKNARKSGNQGSGVGLSAAKSILERFGGRLSLETKENEGSTFTVHLPTCSEEDRQPVSG
jgi:signal transduction histidine kinase